MGNDELEPDYIAPEGEVPEPSHDEHDDEDSVGYAFPEDFPDADDDGVPDIDDFDALEEDEV